MQVLEFAIEPQPTQALMALCSRSSRTKFRDQVVRPLLEAGLLEMTIPDKPTSSRQKYRTTPLGEQLLAAKRR